MCEPATVPVVEDILVEFMGMDWSPAHMPSSKSSLVKPSPSLHRLAQSLLRCGCSCLSSTLSLKPPDSTSALLPISSTLAQCSLGPTMDCRPSGSTLVHRHSGFASDFQASSCALILWLWRVPPSLRFHYCRHSHTSTSVSSTVAHQALDIT